MPVIAVMWAAPSVILSVVFYLLSSSLNFVMVRFLGLVWMGGGAGAAASNRRPVSKRRPGVSKVGGMACRRWA